MTKLKARIISEIESMDNPGTLGEVFDFLRLLRRNKPKPKSNKKAVLSLSGSLSPADAAEMEKIISKEFNNIEGDEI